MTPRTTHCLYLGLLATAVTLLYLQVRRHGYIDFDDTSYLVDNAIVREGLSLAGIRWAFTSTYAANWHPLTWISHMADVSVFGMDPGAHHLVNAALHGIVGWLLYAFGWRYLGRADAAFAMALLFLVHPQHVESVAWLAERKDLLCAAFYLLALIAYRAYVERPSAGRYAWVAVAFAAALLSKPMAVSLPVVLLLLDAWPLERLAKAENGRWLPAGALGVLLEKLPLAAMSLGSCVITVMAQAESAALSSVESLSLGWRIANALIAYALYLRDFLVPNQLAMFYPLQSWHLATQVLPAASIVIALLLLFVRLRRRQPGLLIGYLWFLVTLLPVIGLVQVGAQARADRYMYIPSMGLLLGITALVPRAGSTAYPRAVVAFVVMALFWGPLCYMQIGYWENANVLYRRTADVTRSNLFAEIRLVKSLIARGSLQEAYERAENALRNHPGTGEAYIIMGEVAMAADDPAAAEAWFRRALTLSNRRWHLLNDLGVAVLQQGRHQEGCALLRDAQAIASESTRVRENLTAGACAASGP